MYNNNSTTIQNTEIVFEIHIDMCERKSRESEMKMVSQQQTVVEAAAKSEQNPHINKIDFLICQHTKGSAIAEMICHSDEQDMTERWRASE